MVNIDNITDAEWRKPSNIAQHKVMRDKINEVITVVNEGGGGGSVPAELITDVATLKTDMVTVQNEVALKADEAEVALKADKTEVALKADKTEVALLIAQLFPPVDCTMVPLYNGDTSVRVSLPINAENCTSLYDMFNGCSNLQMVGYIHTPNATDMINMFYGCSSLTTIPSLDTSKVESMSDMFNGCSSLTTIPSLDTSKVTSMPNMFNGCSALTTIPSLDISSVTNMVSMFIGCTSLTSVTFECNDVRPYGTAMFNGTPIASRNGRIYVPDNLVQAYKTASGWSIHASVIYGHSDKT